MTLNIRGKDITVAGTLSEWFESEKVIYMTVYQAFQTVTQAAANRPQSAVKVVWG
jgi:hypothetical protein